MRRPLPTSSSSSSTTSAGWTPATWDRISTKHRRLKHIPGTSTLDPAIRTNKEKPWALYLTHFAVHPPLDAKRELVAKYQAKPAGKLHEHVAMATMIQAVDDGVGRIQETLEALHTGDSPISVLKLAPFRLTRISNS